MRARDSGEHNLLLEGEKVAIHSTVLLLCFLIILTAVAILLPLAITLYSLLTGIIGTILGIMFGIPIILAAGYLLTSLALCSVITPLLPAALPTILVAIIAIIVTAIVMVVIDVLIDTPIRWLTMKNSEASPHIGWKTLALRALRQSRDGIVFCMLPAVFIALACGLPPVATSLHFAGGILPGLISSSAIMIGCIAKSLHHVFQNTVSVPSLLRRSNNNISDNTRSPNPAIETADARWIEQSPIAHPYDDNGPSDVPVATAYPAIVNAERRPDSMEYTLTTLPLNDRMQMILTNHTNTPTGATDVTTINQNNDTPYVNAEKVLSILVLLLLATCAISLFGAILPFFMSLCWALILLSLSSAYLLLPVTYAMISVGICSLVLPLLPITTTLLGSLLTLVTALAITFTVMMVLDIIVDYAVKLFYQSTESNNVLARRSILFTCWTFLLITLPTAIICWACGLPTIVISSGLLSSALPQSTVSIACATSALLSKNALVFTKVIDHGESDIHRSLRSLGAP